jgi:sulfate permease, SulP family
MAGTILLVTGYFRAGRLIAYIPEAVINGFTMGIAVVIATSQLPDFLGLTVEHVPADFIEKIPVLWEARASFSLLAFAIAILTLVLIVALRRLAPGVPGLIIAVAAGSLAIFLFDLPVDTVGSRSDHYPTSCPGRRCRISPSHAWSSFSPQIPALRHGGRSND